MSDSISRQDAINTALEFFVEFLGGAFYEDDQKILMKRMNELPSAEPERPKGEWIVTSEFEDCRYVKCNQCKVTQVFYYNKPLTNFCPECGSYNGGEQNGKIT